VFANVTVTSPSSGATVVTPFSLVATATPCSSQPIASIGYSLDNSSNTTVVNGASINAQVTAPLGGHVLHIKSWGNQGASCVADLPITVTSQPAVAPPANSNASSINVASPAGGSTVAAPFPLIASAEPCSSQSIASMGYSLDNSPTTTIVNGASVNAQVTGTSGAHVLHVKSWGNQGASCVTDVPITIAAGPTIPPNAIAISGIHALKNWQASFDSGTGSGSANGAMSIVKSPSLSGTARQFVTSYANYGGERYSVDFGNDANASNFLYDGWIYLASPTNDVANVEMDLNQVMPNGQTAILGFQCDGWSNTWDYTANTGTPQQPVDQWLHTSATCNPRDWTPNTWHHVQILSSHDDAGNATYKSVWFDGVEQEIDVTAPSAFALGWAPGVLLTNFQVDGIGASGSATMYLDNLTVYRW